MVLVLKSMFQSRNLRVSHQLVTKHKILVQFRYQGPNIDPCTKFQPSQMKNKKVGI